jgi:hypothetical protein
MLEFVDLDAGLCPAFLTAFRGIGSGFMAGAGIRA